MSDERPVRRLLDAFLKEAPWMLGFWVVSVLALIVFGALTGDMNPREALTVAVGFLPLIIPLAPLTWIRFEPRGNNAAAVPSVGLGCLWAVVTMPLAIGLGVVLTKLVGGE